MRVLNLTGGAGNHEALLRAAGREIASLAEEARREGSVVLVAETSSPLLVAFIERIRAPQAGCVLVGLLPVEHARGIVQLVDPVDGPKAFAGELPPEGAWVLSIVGRSVVWAHVARAAVPPFTSKGGSA